MDRYEVAALTENIQTGMNGPGMRRNHDSVKTTSASLVSMYFQRASLTAHSGRLPSCGVGASYRKLVRQSLGVLP